MAKKTKTPEEPKRPTPPAGMIDAADDLYLDMEDAEPDIEDTVYEFDGKGNMRTYPATELPKEEQ